jgi:hypothetical protein
VEENKRTLIQDLINQSRQLVEKRKANQRQYLVIPKEFKRFELEIENSWVRKLKYECQNARAHRDARRRELMGFLGIGFVTLPPRSALFSLSLPLPFSHHLINSSVVLLLMIDRRKQVRLGSNQEVGSRAHPGL